ncbi:MAG TPA: ABC transporter ATP-binding protein [Ktedonobacterales bacterium]|nr:ABC transporter ATP-binding protein [Ktedonobacterales bacterium]
MIRLFRFLKPYRFSLAVVFVLVFAQSIANLYLPTLMADIVDNGIVKNDVGYIERVGVLMLVISLGGVIAAVIAAYFSAHIAVGFGRRIRRELYTHVQQFALREFDRVGTASLITRTTNDTNQVQQVMVIILLMLLGAPLTAIGGIILAIRQDATLTWVLAAAIPILVIAILLLMGQAVPLFRVVQQKLDRLNLIIDEGLTGVRVIRAFDRAAYEEQRFDVANSDLTDVSIRVNRIIAVLFPLMMLVLNLTTVAILWFGAIRVDTAGLQVGTLIAFLQYAILILFSFLMISMLFVMLPRAAASATRINEILAMQPTVTDDTVASAETRAQRVVDGQDALNATVVFDDVTFSYPGAEEPALAHISFEAHPGQVTAIIGGTGSGKSTLINLIPRFYDVDSGRVLVDGADVRSMTQHELRAKIGFVPQTAVLFSGSVSENIRYGKRDATDDEVRHAADTAQATEFVSEMSEGFDAPIAQGGTNVSGGQKQRLSIARALARQPEIYIFDDSFSALDYKTDAQLRAALKKETTRATVLIVAQRVSTVMDADQILVLDEGRLVGTGTHRELMETSPVYREIVFSQLSAEEVA